MVRAGYVGWSVAAATCGFAAIVASHGSLMLDRDGPRRAAGLESARASYLVRVQSDGSRGLVLSGQGRANGRVEVMLDGRRLGIALADTAGRWRLAIAQPLAVGGHRIEVIEPIRQQLLDSVDVWLPDGAGGVLDVAFRSPAPAIDRDRRDIAQAQLLRAGFLQQGVTRPDDARPQRDGAAGRGTQPGGDLGLDLGQAAEDWLRRSHQVYQRQIVPRLSVGGGGDAAARARARTPEGEPQPRAERGAGWWLGDGEGLTLGGIGAWLAQAQRAYRREVVPRLTGERELGLAGRPTMPAGVRGDTVARPEEDPAARRAREDEAARLAAEERRAAEAARRRADEDARRAQADRLAAAEAERKSAAARRLAEGQRAREAAAAQSEVERLRAAELARDAERNAAAALDEAQRRLKQEEAQREAARQNADAVRRKAEAERAQREQDAAARAEIERRRAEDARRAQAAAAERERQRLAEVARRQQQERDAAARAKAEQDAAERARLAAEADRVRREAEVDRARRTRERMARLTPRRDVPDLPERGVVRRVVPTRPLPSSVAPVPDLPERRSFTTVRPNDVARERQRPRRRVDTGDRAGSRERRANPPVRPVRVARPSASPRRVYRVRPYRLVRPVRSAKSVRAGWQRCRQRAGRRIVPPGTYVVRRGDSLWRISRRHYALGRRYRLIHRANLRRVRNPDLIYPCQRLYIPARRRR